LERAVPAVPSLKHSRRFHGGGGTYDGDRDDELLDAGAAHDDGCRTTRRRPRQPAAGPRDGNRDDELMDAADHYCLLLDSVTAMTT
jgi:hypothetical protein